jgi:hypothetical protein
MAENLLQAAPLKSKENESKVSDSNQPRADLDIFPKLAAFLDPHLIIPVLEFFYRGLGIYEEKAVLEAKLEIAKRLETRINSCGVLQSLYQSLLTYYYSLSFFF